MNELIRIDVTPRQHDVWKKLVGHSFAKARIEFGEAVFLSGEGVWYDTGEYIILDSETLSLPIKDVESVLIEVKRWDLEEVQSGEKAELGLDVVVVVVMANGTALVTTEALGFEKFLVKAQ